MSRRDTFRAERTWVLLVVWLLLLIVVHLSPAQASTAVATSEFRMGGLHALQAIGPLEGRTALDDLPREDAEYPGSPASVDETEQQRQADSTSVQACLPAGTVSPPPPGAAGRALDTFQFPSSSFSYGIRDLRGPPRA